MEGLPSPFGSSKQTPSHKVSSGSFLKDVWSVAREGSLSELDSALSLLKKNGGNVDSRNGFGLTPLHIATWRNHLSIVKRLLAAGVDPDARVLQRKTEEATMATKSNFEEVIDKFAQLTPQEKAKRKLESLEALKKTFKKLDHDVNIQDFLGSSTQTIEELTNHSRLLQAQVSEVHRRLRLGVSW